jgi:hypothetical protein
MLTQKRRWAVATATIPVERRALYYPWVHFHSDDWVKKALLVFPGVSAN